MTNNNNKKCNYLLQVSAMANVDGSRLLSFLHDISQVKP